MHALTLHGAHDARLVDLPEPEVGPGQVKVQISYAGICGSDLAIYEYFPVPFEDVHPLFGELGPHVLGHEFAGRVVAVGAGVDGFPLGAIVAVRPIVWDGTCAACRRGEKNLCENLGFLGIHGGGGAFSEYVVVDADAAFLVPEAVGPQAAVMVESTAVAWHAVRISGVQAGSTALIIGAGPIGLALLLCLKAQGVDRVVMSEVSDARRALATELGADVVNPRVTDVVTHVRDYTDGDGVDVAFDASGVGQPTYDAAFDALRHGGTSVVVAQFHEPVSVDLNTFPMTEKHVVGSFAYRNEDFREVVDAISSGRIDPTPLISSVIPLDEVISGGLDHLLGAGRNSEIKVLVTPGV